jgi:hypothetical protein
MRGNTIGVEHFKQPDAVDSAGRATDTDDKGRRGAHEKLFFAGR